MKFLMHKNTKHLLAIGLTALILSGCDQSEQQKSKGPSGPGQMMPKVGVLEAKSTRVPNIFTITGRAEAYTIAEIRPQVEGIIIKRNFTEGRLVKKGEVMYELDPSSYQALYDNAEAAIARSEALLTNAKIKVERNESLVKINAVSEQVLDDARAALREAKANLEANKAALKTAQINLQRTKIKSPIDGLVGRSEVTKGALVTANQASSLATVQQFDPIYVDFSVPSYYAIPLKKAVAKTGKENVEKFPVKILFEDGTEYSHIGKIKLSEFQVNRTTDSIILRTQFDNPDSLLLPGMFIRGTIMTGYKSNIFLVPAIAVGRSPLGTPYVMILDKENTVTVRPVEGDGFYQDKFVIKSGLQEGDRVIVKGLQYIRPGVKAEVLPPAPATDPKAAQKGS